MVPGAHEVCIHPTISRLGRALITQVRKRLLSVVTHSVLVAERVRERARRYKSLKMIHINNANPRHNNRAMVIACNRGRSGSSLGSFGKLWSAMLGVKGPRPDFSSQTRPQVSRGSSPDQSPEPGSPQVWLARSRIARPATRIKWLVL